MHIFTNLFVANMHGVASFWKFILKLCFSYTFFSFRSIDGWMTWFTWFRNYPVANFKRTIAGKLMLVHGIYIYMVHKPKITIFFSLGIFFKSQFSQLGDRVCVCYFLCFSEDEMHYNYEADLMLDTINRRFKLIVLTTYSLGTAMAVIGCLLVVWNWYRTNNNLRKPNKKINK